MSVATETAPDDLLDDEPVDDEPVDDADAVLYSRQYRLANDGQGNRIDIFANDENGQACWRFTVGDQVLEFALNAEEARRAAIATSPDIVLLVKAATRLNLSVLGDEARVTRRSQTRLISIWPILDVQEALALVQRSAHVVRSRTTWRRLVTGHQS